MTSVKMSWQTEAQSHLQPLGAPLPPTTSPAGAEGQGLCHLKFLVLPLRPSISSSACAIQPGLKHQQWQDRLGAGARMPTREGHAFQSQLGLPGCVCPRPCPSWVWPGSI